MAVAPQAPGALDLWVVAGDPATWTVTLDGPTAIASPSWVLLDGIGGDEITGLDASAEVSGLDVTLDLSADDTAALKARDSQIKVTRVRHTIGLVVDGYGPVQVLAGEVELLPRGSAPRPPSQSSTSFSLANGLTVTVTVQLGGKTNLSATASPTGVTVVSSTGTDAVLPLADATNAGLMAPAQHSKLAGIEAGATADMTAAEILTAVKTVDGASSGLDADLLDGQHAAAFEAAGTAASAVAAHEAAADPHPTYTTAAELTSALAGKQPLDSDLTAIAALSTTSYGRSLLELANAAALATSVATQTAFSSRYVAVVNHGATAGTARVGTAPCLWIGSVDPTNAANDDELYRTDTTALYKRVSAAWVEVGSSRFGALNENGFTSNSATLPPTQRSTTNYLTAKVPTGAIVFPNTTGNYASAADAAALDVTGDAEWVIDLAMVDWTPSSATDLVLRGTADPNRAWTIRLLTSGAIQLRWYPTGSAASLITANSTASVSFTDGARGLIKVTLDVDNGASGYDVKFYTSADGITWTQLGSTVTGGATTSLANVAASLVVAAGDLGGAAVFNGTIVRFVFRNGIGGTVAAELDNRAGWATRFRDSAGNTWTTTGSAWAWTTVPF